MNLKYIKPIAHHFIPGEVKVCPWKKACKQMFKTVWLTIAKTEWKPSIWPLRGEGTTKYWYMGYYIFILPIHSSRKSMSTHHIKIILDWTLQNLLDLTCYKSRMITHFILFLKFKLYKNASKLKKFFYINILW